VISLLVHVQSSSQYGVGDGTMRTWIISAVTVSVMVGSVEQPTVVVTVSVVVIVTTLSSVVGA